LALGIVTKVYEIDPLTDERWVTFLGKHRLAALFHSPEWLRALRRTYRYEAGVLTTSGPGESLSNGLAFCRVRSWLTGARLVSLPFADHSTPLYEAEGELVCLLSHLKQECDRGKERYLEIRSAVKSAAGMADSASFILHRIDLRPELSELFRALHGNCIRRKIVRAEREGVTYEEGTSEDMLRRFYKLTVLTRRRHSVPPQPISWFRNLIACMGDKVKIRLASCEGLPAAGILTIRYKATMTYKYGCSDSRFHKFGPIQLLMWKAIEEAKRDGLLEFDMGRTDGGNEGLLLFKDRWGGTRSTLTYVRYPEPKPQRTGKITSMRMAKSLIALAPTSLLARAGNILYPHID
jgi:CelD/BcsL family acetyltransferase involved in cellulose biosynthesis